MDITALIISVGGGILMCSLIAWVMWLVEKPDKKSCPDPFKDKVNCEECRGWFDVEDCQEIKTVGFHSNYLNFYCPTHKKDYDKKYSYSFKKDGLTHLGFSYFKELEVSEDGTPIGYKKINAKTHK